MINGTWKWRYQIWENCTVWHRRSRAVSISSYVSIRLLHKSPSGIYIQLYIIEKLLNAFLSPFISLWWFLAYSAAFKWIPISPYLPRVEWKLHPQEAFCIVQRQRSLQLIMLMTFRSGAGAESYILSLGCVEILHLFLGWCYITILSAV